MRKRDGERQGLFASAHVKECEMTSSHSVHLIKGSGGVQLGSTESLVKRTARGETKSYIHTQRCAELSRIVIQPS